MRHLNIHKKRRTAWPWAAGVVILGMIVWSVTALLAAPERETVVVTDPAVDSLPPALIPAPPNPVRSTAIQSLAALSPLDEEDAGHEVRAEGEVVATGTTGFWILVGSEVIRVDSHQMVRRGDTVAVQGRLDPLENVERTDRVAAEVLTRDPRSDQWTVVRSLRLIAEGNGTP
jgi:hypothetical protein